MNERDIVSKLKFRVYHDYPFYADLSLNREHIFTNFIEWFATTGEQILINPNSIKEFTFEENLFAYLHELLHIALKHTFIGKKHSDKDQFLLNIAQDIIVNELVSELVKPSIKLQETLVFKEKFNELRRIDVKKLNHLEIYDILAKKFERAMQSLKLPNPNANLKSNSNLNDIAKDFMEKFTNFDKQLQKLKSQGEITENEEWIFKNAYKDYYFNKLFEKLSDKEKKKILDKIKDDLLSGYVHAKQRGFKFSGMEKLVEHLFKKVRDWRKVLREEILDYLKGDWTWAKVSDNLQSLHVAGFKQIGNLPSLDNTFALGKIIIGIDVSGSISDEDYKDFLDEIYSIFKSVNVREFEIVMWEWEITKVINGRNGFVNKVLNELKKRKGYGGTKLRSFLEYCNKKGVLNSIAIILTDGYVEYDLKVSEFRNFKKVIFVLTRDCDYENIAKLKSPKIKILRMRR